MVVYLLVVKFCGKSEVICGFFFFLEVIWIFDCTGDQSLLKGQLYSHIKTTPRCRGVSTHPRTYFEKLNGRSTRKDDIHKNNSNESSNKNQKKLESHILKDINNWADTPHS